MKLIVIWFAAWIITHTQFFEIMSEAPKMGAQSTICAGGRYNGLVEELGGPDTPGFGFGMGIERVLLTMEAEEVVIPALSELDAYVVGIGSETNVANFATCSKHS